MYIMTKSNSNIEYSIAADYSNLKPKYCTVN